VQKNRTEGGGGGALDGKVCAENRTEDDGSARMGECVKKERTEIMMALGTGKCVVGNWAEDSASLLCNQNQQNAHFFSLMI
jgi:hypothetical protein